MITDSKDSYLYFLCIKSASQIPQNPKKSKINCRLVSVSRGSDDFFAGGVHWQLIAEKQFM